MMSDKCNHFYLPYRVVIKKKYNQDHDSYGKKYRWQDAVEVERVYCAKCGDIGYPDLSHLKPQDNE